MENFYSELATKLVKKLPIAHNKFNNGTSKDYYTDIVNIKRNEFQSFKISEDLVKKKFCLTTRIQATNF